MSTFEVLNSAVEAEEFLGPNFVSRLGIFTSPLWWRGVEHVRPEVTIKYVATKSAQGHIAVMPAYFYPQGRRGEPYAADFGFDKSSWPAYLAASPWVILGGCSGFFTDLTHSPDWPMADALRALLPKALDYLQAQGFNVVIKYFGSAVRSAIAEILSLSELSMPLIDVQAVLKVQPNLDKYIAVLPGQFRGFVRRDIARFQQSGCSVDRPTMAAVLSELPLYWDAVEVHHGSRPNISLRASILQGEALALGGHAEIFRVLDDEGVTVAISLNYRFEKTMVCRLVGLDYDRSVPSAAYFISMYYEPLKWAGANGIEKIILGTGAIKAKVMRGAELLPVYAFYRDVDGRTLSVEAGQEYSTSVTRRLRADLQNVSRRAFRRPDFMGVDDTCEV